MHYYNNVSVTQCSLVFEESVWWDLYSQQHHPESTDDSSLVESSVKMSGSSPMMCVVDPYRILQVRRDATYSEIRHSYKRLSLWHHPGRRFSASLEERARRQQVFEVLAACYETLKDKEARSKCDALLKGKEQHGPEMASVPALSAVSSESSDESDPEPDAPSNEPHDASNDSGDLPPMLTVDPLQPAIDAMNEVSLVTDTDLQRGATSFQSWPSNQQQQQQKHQRPDTFSLLYCIHPTMPSLGHSTGCSGASSGNEIHYTERETNRLFGGPLQLLYRARRWRPFRDPFEVFAEVFQSEVSFGDILTKQGNYNPVPLRTSAWTGSSQRLPDGTLVCITARTLHDRVLVRKETIQTTKGHRRKSTVTVTSEPLSEPEPPVDSGCVPLQMCLQFIADATEGDTKDQWCNPWLLPQCV